MLVDDTLGPGAEEPDGHCDGGTTRLAGPRCLRADAGPRWEVSVVGLPGVLDLARDAATPRLGRMRSCRGFFSFLYLKKIQKYMSNM